MPTLFESLGIEDPDTPVAPPPPPERGVGGVVKDAAKSFAQGALELPGQAAGLADVVPALVAGKRPFTAAADYLGDATGFKPGTWAKEIQLSPQAQAAQKEVDDVWNDKNATAADIAAAYVKNPSYVLNLVAQSLPSMVAGGLGGRALMAAGRVAPAAEGAAALPGYLERVAGDWAPAIAGGVGEGSQQVGQQMQQGEGNADQRKNAIAALASGGIDAVIGAGAGRVANKLGLETLQTKIAGGARTGAVLGPMARIAGGAAEEGLLQELPQSAQEQVWQNYAEGKPLWDGVPRQAIEGALAGLASGGAVNIPGGHDAHVETSAVPPPPVTGPLSRAANANPNVAAAGGLDAVMPPAPGSAEEAATAPAQPPAIDPVLERIKTLEGSDRGEALAAYNLLSRDDTPKGVRQYNSKLLDDLLAKLEPQEPGAAPVESSDPAALLSQGMNADPLQQALASRRDEQTAQANLATWMQRAAPLPLEQAQGIQEAGAARGYDLSVVPHSAGQGFTVIPSEWVTPAMRSQVATAIPMDAAPTGVLRADAQGNVAPETRVQAIDTQQAADAAAAERARKDALGLTPDVEAVQAGVKRAPLPIAQAGDVTLKSGEPFKNKGAAMRAQAKTGAGAVLQVQGGWVVRTQPTQEVSDVRDAGATGSVASAPVGQLGGERGGSGSHADVPGRGTGGGSDAVSAGPAASGEAGHAVRAGAGEQAAGVAPAAPKEQTAPGGERWSAADAPAREKLLLAAGWKPGSPGLEKMKAQAWEKMTQGQRNRIAKALAVEPVQQRQPEGTPVNDMPSKAPGERWTTDRGAMPGEPFAYLDGDAETGVAAMREVENPGRGTSHYEVHDTAGSLLASGDTEAEAARLAEKRVDAKPATAPAKTKGEPHAQDADSAGRDGGVQPATAPAAAADTAVRQGELSKPEATGQTEKRAPKPRMGETADALWAAIKKDSTGVVYEGRIIVPTLRVVGGDDFKLNAKGELEVVDRKSGGIGVRDATEAEANEFHRDLDGDRVQVLLMSAPGYGSGYRAQKVLKELHSPSGLSFQGKTSTKAPAEQPKDQPHAAEQVPEPSGVRAEPENGAGGRETEAAGAGDRVQRAEGSEEGKTAPASGGSERDGGVAPGEKPRKRVRKKAVAADDATQFRRTDGTPAGNDLDARKEAIQKFVNAITAKWANAPQVVVVRDMQDEAVPQKVRDTDAAQRSQGAGEVVHGFHYQGKVYLVAEGISSPSEALETLAHEVLGHAGLQGLFGDALTPIKKQIVAMRKREVLAKAADYGMPVTPEAVRAELGRGATPEDVKRVIDMRLQYAAEEVLAEMAQKTPQLGFVRRAIAAIRAWLRDHVPSFKDLALTDDEIIRRYIIPARGWIVNGDGTGARRSSEDVSFSREQPATIRQIGSKWAVVRKTNTGEAHDYYDSEDAARAALTEQQARARLEANRSAGAHAAWWVEDPAEFVQSTGQRRLDSVARAAARRRTLLARRNPVKTAEEAASLRQIESRAGFCFKVAAEASANGIGDMVIGATHDPKGDPIWHAVVMRDGMVYDPTFSRWFSPGVYESMDFQPKLTLTTEQVQDYLERTGGMSPDAKNQGLGDAPGDVNFSRTAAGTNPATAQPLHREIMQAMNDTFNAPGKLNWWHKTIGTQYNLAQRSPEYKRVFDSVQDFINDVSLYATEAADLAPKILPKLDTFKDIGKKPIAAADNKAISAPIFEGTLAWTRDEKGRPVKVDDAEKAAGTMSADDKARELLRRGLLPENVLKMWQGRPQDEYRQAVATAYKNRVLKPGIVWSDDELRSVFKLTEPQIALYHEFRNAVDRSITAMAISDMVRYAGKDLTPEVRQEVLASPDVDAAALMLRDHLLKLAGEQADRNDVLTNAAQTMIEKADRARELMDRGYAPLSRFGHYTVDVVDKNGERVYFGMFENAREAALMARKMRANFPEATISRGTVSQEEYKLFAGVSPETVELFGELLGLEGQGDDPASKAFQTYIKVAKANRSAMKRLIERKGIAGFSEDVGRVLAGFIYSNARQTSQNLHMGEMTSAASDIPKGQGELKDQATKLVEYVKNPQEEAQGLRGLLFAQYLGGSVASAMVNMLQPVQVTLPYLSQYGGAAKAAASMAKAFADVRKKTTGDKALDAALKRAEEEGIVAPQEVFQLMAQARGRGVLKSGDGTAMGNARATASNAFSRLALAWGKIFGFAEQVNRRVTFIAAYRTAQREGIADPAKFAEKAVVETQFLYNKGNKPNWARGAIGSTLFTFKSYSISYLELLHRMATQGGPQGKRAVLLALGMLFLFGGAGGLPFADDLDDLIDGVMQRLGYNFSSKLAKRQFFQKVLGRELGGMAEHGLSGLPGVPIDVSGRLGMGNLIPGTGFLVDKQDHTSDATEFLGAGGDFAKRLFTGANKAAQGDFFGAAGDVAPRAAANAQKALEMYTTGQYKDANGRKVIDTDGFDALSKAIGFQPNDVAQVQQATGMQQQLIANVKLQTTRFADAWAKAVVDGDQDALQKVRQQVAQWNRDNPEAPISINRAQILSRVKAMREDKATRLQKTAPKAIRANVRQALAPEAAS